MKIELEKEKAKELIKKIRELCREYNGFPMGELDLKTGIVHPKVYQLNKLTMKEKEGGL